MAHETTKTFTIFVSDERFKSCHKDHGGLWISQSIHVQPSKETLGGLLDRIRSIWNHVNNPKSRPSDHPSSGLGLVGAEDGRMILELDALEGTDSDAMVLGLPVETVWNIEITPMIYVASLGKEPIRYHLRTSLMDGDAFEVFLSSSCYPLGVLKNMASQILNIPRTYIRLIFAGKQLEDHRRAIDYCMQKDSVIHVVVTR
jgi:hypothetical protein